MPTTAPAPTRRRALRTVAAVGAAALATGSLAACGSSEDGAPSAGGSVASASAKASPAELLKEAPAATKAKGSSHIAITATVSEGSKPQTIHLEGDQSTSPTQAQLRVTAPSLGAGDLQVRYRDGKLYAKPAGMPRWFGLDVAQFTKQLGPEGTSLAKGSSPTQVVEALQKSGKLDDAGSTEIDGTAVRHLRGTVTTRALVESAKGAQKRAYDQLGALSSSDPELKRQLDAPIGMDFYLQGDGAIRRMVVKATLPGEGPATAQIDLTDFGKDVDVQAPPAGQTQELTPDAIGGLLGGGASASASPVAP